MKKLFATSLLCALAVAPAIAGLSNQEMNKALQAIRQRNTPRYCYYLHQNIVDEYLAFAKTNDLTYLQKVEFNRKLVDSASEIKDKSIYEAAVAEIRACTNTHVRVSTMRSLIYGFSHLYFSENQWKLAMKEFDADPKLFDAGTRMDMNSTFATSYSRLCDYEGFVRRYLMITSEVPDKVEDRTDPKSQFNRQRARAMLNAINACLTFRRKEAQAFFEKSRALFDERQINSFYNTLAKAYVGAKDRESFDAILKMVQGYPLEKRGAPYRDLLSQLHGFDKELARKLVDKELSNKSLTPAERSAYLAQMQNFHSPSTFNYGFNEPGLYEAYRKILRERIALMKAHKDDKGCDFLRDRWFCGIVDVVIWFDDLAFADELVEMKLAADPKDRDMLQRKAQLLAIKGDAAGAAKALEAVLATPRCSAAITNDTLPVIAFLKGQGMKGFNAAVAPRKLNSVDRLRALRKTSLELFKMRRYDDNRVILDEIYKNMYLQEPDRICTATYVANAPKSADGFVRSPFYNDWKSMTTSFKVYGDGYSESGTTDEKRHLKDAKQPVPNPDYPTGVRVLYDEQGVHVFIRCDDPQIADIKLGKKDAGTLELFFRPGGDDKPYHSLFFDGLPKADDPHAANWAMPGRHYRRTQDAFEKDAALTDKGCVAHLSIPWISFYDDLPLEGNDWVLGVMRWCSGGGFSSGGIVHELSRGLKIRFPMNAKQIADLKRDVSITAFNRYNKIRRNEGAFLLTWNDPVLGDPDFYKAEVEPLVKELDETGAKLLDKASDQDVAKIFRDIVPLWAEINYEIAERRTRYLNDRLFEE